MMYSNVQPYPSISDNNAPYTIAKIPAIQYQSRYKFIREMKNFDLQKYIDDFKQLPFSIVSSSDIPIDKLVALNKISHECIERHAPLKRINLLPSAAPWMKDLNMVALQNQTDKLGTKHIRKGQHQLGLHTGK